MGIGKRQLNVWELLIQSRTDKKVVTHQDKQSNKFGSLSHIE